VNVGFAFFIYHLLLFFSLNYLTTIGYPLNKLIMPSFWCGYSCTCIRL